MAQEYGRGLMGLSEATSQYTFPGVLHHLQSEWRQYERERNEWEIERAEMRARIALLEGERASMENAKTDLMRRVKMLEFALRQERARYLAATAQVSEASGRASPASPSEGASQDKPAPDHDDKHERERARERDDDHDPPAHDAHAHDRDHDDARPNRLPTMPSRPLSSRGSRPDSALGAPMAGLLVQKDPKSRVRSREFMQQYVDCLPSRAPCALPFVLYAC